MSFQFHKGTIKTIVSTIRRNSIILFQFHKGTIKTLNKGTAFQAFSAISIP